MRRINVDMDGVVADFDRHHFNLFGIWPTRYPAKENLSWDRIRTVPDFFRTIPETLDARDLMRGVIATGLPWRFLTGCPPEIDVTRKQKTEWSAEFAARLGLPDREIICCSSRTKRLHCEPGDILIDDYLKYKHLWEEAGGIFIVHTSAAESIRQLREVLAW